MDSCGPCLTGAAEGSLQTGEAVTGPPGVVGKMLAQAMAVALKGVGPESAGGMPRLDGAVALARAQEQKVELEFSNASTSGQDVRRRAAERLVVSQVILPTASGASNEGPRSRVLGLAPPFLGPGFRLGARWDRVGEAVKTHKKREKTGKKWARYGLQTK